MNGSIQIQIRTHEREAGNALLIGVVITLILFGFVASLVISSTTSAHAVSDAADQLAAMYVAQHGLAEAKLELALDDDADGDGLGTVAGTTDGGSYQVLATDLGGNLYQLDVVSTSRAGRSTLREIVEVASDVKFPPGAMSIVGAVDRTRLTMKKDFGLVMDGADTAALSIADATLFREMVEEFVAALESGMLPLDNLTGAITTPMDINGAIEDVPIVHNPDYDTALDDMDAFYDELITGVQNLIPAATQVTVPFTSKNDTFEYGTPESPVLIHFNVPTFLYDKGKGKTK